MDVVEGFDVLDVLDVLDVATVLPDVVLVSGSARPVEASDDPLGSTEHALRSSKAAEATAILNIG